MLKLRKHEMIVKNWMHYMMKVELEEIILIKKIDPIVKNTRERKIDQKIKRSSDQIIKKKPKLTYFFTCAFCPEKLDDDAAFKVHINSKHLDHLSKLPCEICYYLAEDTKALKYHQLFHHQMVSVGQKKMKIPIFKCTFCSEKFDNNAALKVHINYKHWYDLSKFPCKNVIISLLFPHQIVSVKKKNGKNSFQLTRKV